MAIRNQVYLAYILMAAAVTGLICFYLLLHQSRHIQEGEEADLVTAK
jgi:hypothetical protein